MRLFLRNSDTRSIELLCAVGFAIYICYQRAVRSWTRGARFSFGTVVTPRLSAGIEK